MQRFAMLAIAYAVSTYMLAGPAFPSPAASPPPELATATPPGAASAPLDPEPVPSGFPTPVACDNAGFLTLAAEHPNGYNEVTVCGNVTQVLPERTTASGLHKYFFVSVDAAGDTIEIVTNIDVTGEFDVRVGALAKVHGRYYRDTIGSQGIDWTHRNVAGATWPFPGYVQIDGGRLVF